MMATVEPLVLESPAKLNLFLHVTGRREDGYHDLDTLMVPLDLCDRVVIEAGTEGIRIGCPGHPELAGPANLAHRAAELFAREADRQIDVNLSIHKKIPIAAGLGGGSSNAAATLRGLEALTGLRLAPGKLAEIALQLGADVPFFLQGGACRARGVGELLEPMPDLPPFFVILACAPFGLSTRKVYERLNCPLTFHRRNANHLSPVSVVEYDDYAARAHNDLQPIAEQIHPGIARVRKEMRHSGADAVLMTGSGPTVFGLFRSREDAEGALAKLTKEPKWKYLVARGMTSGKRATE